MNESACLVLADGSVYRGEGFGARAEGTGELVFHTGMTGYQEILTDPSYRGQIVCMTCPEIGNVGTNPEDEESDGLHVRALVVRDHVDFPSSWRSRASLQEYLVEHGTPGISGIDTRALVRRIRSSGSMNAVLVAGDCDLEKARRRGVTTQPEYRIVGLAHQVRGEYALAAEAFERALAIGGFQDDLVREELVRMRERMPGSG